MGQQSVTVDASGNYSVTFFDPLRIVAESGNQLEITVTDSLEETFQSTHSLTAAEVKAGQININLATPFPSRTNSLTVSGQTYLVGGEVKAPSGLTVTVSVGETEGSGTTDGTGSYSVTLGDGTTAIAETDSEVMVTVNDGTKDRGSDSDRLIVDQVVGGQIAVDVITDLKQTTNVLVISGSVLLKDGVTLAGPGLKMGIKNAIADRGSSSTTTEADGSFAATFFDPLSIVAETDDQLEISATDVDDTVYTQTHVVTSKEALEGQVNTNLETPFPARNATIELSGSVYREGGEILAPAGLTVTAAIGAATKTTTTAADGSYSIKVNTAVQTGSEVSIAVTDDSGQRGSITRILATAEVSVGAANADVPTDIGATTELLTVTGQVTAEDGNPVGSDVKVVATLREATQQVNTEANGSYSVSFVNLLGIVAENGDLLKQTKE